LPSLKARRNIDIWDTAQQQQSSWRKISVRLANQCISSIWILSRMCSYIMHHTASHMHSLVQGWFHHPNQISHVRRWYLLM
jgi:hypothetical protein